MDPNETLRRARASAAVLIALIDRGAIDDEDAGIDDINTLAESFQALDSWLNRGGALPIEWCQCLAVNAPSDSLMLRCPACGGECSETHIGADNLCYDPSCAIHH